MIDLRIEFDRSPEALVASVAGEIDLTNADLLQERLVGALDAETALVVDLSAVSYLDSSALACLHRVSLVAGDAGTRMVVVTGDGGAARRLLAITGLDEVLGTALSVADARSMLGGPSAGADQ